MPSARATRRTAQPMALPEAERRARLPPLLRADAANDAPRWAARNREALLAAVAETGAVVVRGLGLRDAATVEAVCRQLGKPMIEREAFAARRRLSDVLYSSSHWPPNQPMCMHHEQSYALEFPSLMLFACTTAPADGGATTVADSAAVLRALPRELVERFERTGWLLIRNYNGEIGASIADAFGTDDRGAVEDYCRANAIAFEWPPDGGLRTRQFRSAVVRHPRSGLRCWFNQIAFLSSWTLDPELREYLVDSYGEDGLPFDTRFGNGDPLDADTVQTINAVYDSHTVRDGWQSGDLMLVDNIRMAHGREPYAGPREILVAMADATKLAACSPTIDVTAAEAR